MPSMGTGTSLPGLPRTSSIWEPTERDARVAADRNDFWAKAGVIKETLRALSNERGFDAAVELVEASWMPWQCRHLIRTVLTPDCRPLHETQMGAIEDERIAELVVDWALLEKQAADVRREDLFSEQDEAGIDTASNANTAAVQARQGLRQYRYLAEDGRSYQKYRSYRKRKNTLVARKQAILSRSVRGRSHEEEQ